MGLSFSVFENIQNIVGNGQMSINNNFEIINYHYSVYMGNNERLVFFQPMECEPLPELILKQFLLKINVNGLSFKKSFKYTGSLIFLFKNLREKKKKKTAVELLLVFSITEDSRISYFKGISVT